MNAGWVAGSVRARALTRRRLGAAGARQVAAAGSDAAAVALVSDSPYGHEVRPEMAIDAAGRAVGVVCLWHLRVLAGWLPAPGREILRVFAAPFEMENIADRLATLDRGDAPVPYPLGSLGVAWPRLASAGGAEDVRAELAASAWGDPGSTDRADTAAVLEARWAAWLRSRVPEAAEWAAGAAALVVARRLEAGGAIPPAASGDLDALLGGGWEDATTPATLRDRLAPGAGWVLAGLTTADDVWLAEGRWWRRVDRDATAALRRSRPGPAIAAAAAARLVVDARRVRAALEAAAWGRAGVEAFDAVA